MTNKNAGHPYYYYVVSTISTLARVYRYVHWPECTGSAIRRNILSEDMWWVGALATQLGTDANDEKWYSYPISFGETWVILIDWIPGQGSGVWDFNLSNAICMEGRKGHNSVLLFQLQFKHYIFVFISFVTFVILILSLSFYHSNIRLQ